MPRKKENLIGKTINGILVIDEIRLGSENRPHWVCKCYCGNIFNTRHSYLTSGRISSCGCKKSTNDISGNKYGKLTVLSQAKSTASREIVWNCVCECGNTLSILGKNLTEKSSCKECYLDNLEGKSFGNLIVIEEVERRGYRRYWLCECSCGETTEVSQSHLVTGRIKSCGCLLNRRGEYSPFWNPSISVEERIDKRSGAEYGDWRLSVYEKDSYTCVSCLDNKGGNLVAHHKDGHNWCKERRLDVSNGATLCEECHKDFHSKYGYGDNTEYQFDEWIKGGVLL